MPKNDILENIRVDKLIFGGKGLGLAPDGRKVIISGGVIPGSIIDIRVLKAKKSHYEGQQIRVVTKSPLEVPLPEGFQMYGGAKWLTIGYEDQLQIKAGQVEEAFFHLLRDVEHPPIFHPIIPSPEIYGYRNKVEFSWGKYISLREGIHDDFRFGFHAQGQFDRIENCTYCALADDEINSIFHTVDSLSRASGFTTYDPKTREGFWRHLVIRKGKSAGEVMLVFSVNGTMKTQGVTELFAELTSQLTTKFSNIASLYCLENTGPADIVTGTPHLIYGRESISAELLGLSFQIQPKSFFQVNTLGAEKLYTLAIDSIEKKGGILLDLYAGTGTIGILLAKYFAQVYSVELVADACRDGEKNALANAVHNVEFINKKVEDFAREFAEKNKEQKSSVTSGQLLSKGAIADTIVLDPPRDGLHPSAIPHILSFGASEIIYVSCNPATLARDLELFIGKNRDEKSENLPIYRITDVTPVDMFPHTHHIETVVRMEKV